MLHDLHFQRTSSMTQPTKPISLSDTEQSAEAAPTERASKSVSVGGKASVPSIIHELYSAPTLYPGEDPALFERLFEDLAHALAPAGLIQGLLVAELWTAILDEGRYRKMLAMIMSPQELVEPEVSEQERIWAEVVEEVQAQCERERAVAKTNAPELERRAAVSNFQNHSREIERLDYLIERCRKARTSILSQLEAMKTVSSSLHRAAEIEDIEFTAAAE